MDKTLLINLLRKFVSLRPGLKYGNYGCPTAYRAELRRVGRQLRDARTLLAAVEASPITGDQIAAALQSGRLTLYTAPNGGVSLEFVAGQYEPIEYRPAVSRVCSDLLWTHVRAHWPHYDGTDIRAHFRRWFGRGIASVWFN
jgi:hypothetical protein